MRKKGSRPLTSNPALEDISRTRDRDMFGQLSVRNWSCIILDFADEASKKLGKKARELYYRMAQSAEAFATSFEGWSEQEIINMILTNYVIPSIQESGKYTEAGQVTAMPILPLTLTWRNYDATAQVSEMTSVMQWPYYAYPVTLYLIQIATNLDFDYTRIARSHTFYYLSLTAPSLYLYFHTLTREQRLAEYIRVQYITYMSP